MSRKHVLIASFLIGYSLTHWYGLTALPVFADEAIYIRWAQLIIDDWRQYLFFPLNDGKTPLFFWLQVPFLLLMKDQLFASRTVSVLIGLLQSFVIAKITKVGGGGNKAQWFSAILVAILPFWFFHHRMALIDGLLTFLLSIVTYFFWVAAKRDPAKTTGKWMNWAKKTLLNRSFLLLVFCAGAALGAGLWTKLPAVLLIPALAILAISAKFSRAQYVKNAALFSGTIGFALFLFALMRIHPAFPQLFRRGGDFLHPMSGIFSLDVLSQTLPSIPTYAGYFIQYASPVAWLFVLYGLFYGKHKGSVHQLFWAGMVFLMPMVVLGKVVFPRYLLPAMIFFTPALALSIESMVDNLKFQSKLTALGAGKMVFVAVLLANVATHSFQFILPAMISPEDIPFVSSDAEQYLLEWSSGHGIAETAELIAQAAEKEKVAVATEGFFGTLPDGLLLNFHNRPVDNISIEGIGQPVGDVPDEFWSKHSTFERFWLVVNSHRLLKKPDGYLLAEFCRPAQAPCLQVWELNPPTLDVNE